MILATSALWASLAWTIGTALALNDGHFTYMLDDPYIHLAVAKNLLLHGVWGVTRYEFSSSTSSLLWPLLLAGADAIFGVNDLAPLVINIVTASLLVFLADRLLLRYGLQPSSRLAVLLLIVFVTPLPALVATGMENTLQTLLVLAYAGLATRELGRASGVAQTRVSKGLIALTPFVAMARYEDLSLICLVAIVLAIRHRWRRAALTLVLAFLPLLAFGVISVHAGSFFVPNSILLKSHNLGTPSTSALVAMARADANNLGREPTLVVLLVLAIGLLAHRVWTTRSANDERAGLLVAYCVMTVVHAHFALINVLFRYEAYLVALGIIAVSLAVSRPDLSRLRPASRIGIRTAILLSLVVGAIPPLARAVLSMQMTPWGMKNIYEQQFQMARFVGAYYPGAAVALNDIGVVDDLDDIRCFDLIGLASSDVARSRESGTYTSTEISRLARANGVVVAIAYDRGFRDGWITTDGVPSDWIKVGQWTIPHATVSYPTVSFYALNQSQAAALAANLRQFAPSLPSDVKSEWDP